MKTAASALALAVLLTNPSFATVFWVSEHDHTRIVHGEVVGATHTKSGKGQ